MDYPQARSRACSHMALQQPHAGGNICSCSPNVCSEMQERIKVFVPLLGPRAFLPEQKSCASWTSRRRQVGIFCDTNPERPPPAHSLLPESATPSEGHPENEPWAAVWH